MENKCLIIAIKGEKSITVMNKWMNKWGLLSEALGTEPEVNFTGFPGKKLF